MRLLSKLIICGLLVLMMGAISSVAAQIAVNVDIKPQSCPNPLNTNSKGILPVAILSTEDFDVMTVDPATVRLQGVAPLRWSWEDVSTPYYDGDPYGCTDEGPDGYMDLILKFDTQEIAAALGPVSAGDRTMRPLTLWGNLREELNGTRIEGLDWVHIIYHDD